MKRKVLSMLLAASLAASVCACGSSGGSTSSESAAAPAETEGTEEGTSDDSAAAATATEGDSYTINVASSFAAEGPMQEIMEGFKANIESETGGRIQVVLHPSGALGSVKEIAEGLKAGTIEMGAIALEDCDYYCPEYSILEAPYLFKDQDHFKRVLDEHGDQLFSEIEEKTGIRTCTWFYRGARMITANKEIKTPDDLAGLKFRLPSMPLRIAVFEAFGASPTVVEFSELYMALKTGTVDAQENPPETIYSYKYYEAQKYLILSRHIYTMARFGASAVWMDTLSQEDQDLIMKAWADARNEVTEKYPDPDETYIQKCEEAGMTVVTPENEKFIELAKPAVEKWAAENGAEDILTLINNTQ